MKRNDKRGLSAIVATVLIIGITVGVIAIVGNFIIGMVQENLQEGTLCSKAATQVLIQTGEGLTCYNSTHMNIQLSYGSEEAQLKGIKVYFKEEGSDVTTTDVTTGLPTLGLTRVVPVGYTSGTTFDSFAIAPIVGAGEKVCPKSQYITAIAC